MKERRGEDVASRIKQEKGVSILGATWGSSEIRFLKMYPLVGHLQSV